MIRIVTLLLGLMVLPVLRLGAQDVPDTVPARIIDGDTIPVIDLRAVMTFPPYDTPKRKGGMSYNRLVYHVKKVYPYAMLASEKLEEFNEEMEKIPTEKGRKAYLRKAEKQLQDEFGPELKELTFTQGKILIKLIHRQTGSSSFELVKELRGKFNAFIWQTMASIFGYDLKTIYDPVHDPQDQVIERIVLAIEDGNL